ncbi:hypothetical protein M514_22220 [Trichuris suis]|uniref:EGF-like domain-containing protein n=1 Tax=Trichuris suis TaxID=68888 RepID=A0A085N829_9BILA|nr:hypothetical protein M514_22220 [Trichuris suis]
MLPQAFHVALLLYTLSIRVVRGEQENTNKSIICAPGSNGKDCAGKERRAARGCPDFACSHGAICHSIGSYKRCICPIGRAGHYCEKSSERCTNDYICLNGGTCVIFDEQKSCVCPLNYKGPYCEIGIALGICDNSTCGHGECIQHGPDVFGCKCDPGYEGINCDKGINECQSSPCKNGGECRDLVDDYFCKCMEGFRGKNCEINACKPGLCVFGTCRTLPTGYQCDCMFGFKGPRCMEEAKACDLSPCKNNGICLVLRDGYRCLCPSAFTGSECELPNLPETAVKVGIKGRTLPVDSMGGILILSLGCIVIIAAIIFFGWIAIRRRKLLSDESSLSMSKNDSDKDVLIDEQRPSEQDNRKSSERFSLGKVYGGSLPNAAESHRRSSAENSVNKEEASEQPTGRSAGRFKSYGMLLRQWLNDLKRRSSSIDTQPMPESKSVPNVPVEQGAQSSAERNSVDPSQQQ